MKIIVISFLMVSLCFFAFAEVKLYHYTDKATGDERGVCYSGVDGKPTKNPDWDYEVISESQKQHYIGLQKQQEKAKETADKALIKKEKDNARNRLKTAGYSDKEIDVLLGETKNILPQQVIL